MRTVDIIGKQEDCNFLENAYNKIIDHYGKDNQIQKAVEELGELTEAIKDGDKKHIGEEIADVLVMIEQLKRIYDIPDAYIRCTIDYKLARQLMRMSEEKD